MPAFRWEAGGIDYPWEDVIHDASELVYRMVHELEQIEDIGDVKAIYLGMYSALETRWCIMEGFPVVSGEWPFIDLNELFRRRHATWDEVRQHAQGFRDIMNPCGEIPLEETCEGTLLQWNPEAWKELIRGGAYFADEPGFVARK